MADKVDFKTTLAAYRARAGEFRVLDVPAMQYLMIDGHGDPNTAPQYAEALATLYPLAYALKFASKRDLGRDYVVPPLEGLWWADDMSTFTTARDKSQWDWTMMLMVPDWIDTECYAASLSQVSAKKDLPRLDDLRLASLSEGRCVQTLHVGGYDDEATARCPDQVCQRGVRLRHFWVRRTPFAMPCSAPGASASSWTQDTRIRSRSTSGSSVEGLTSLRSGREWAQRWPFDSPTRRIGGIPPGA